MRIVTVTDVLGLGARLPAGYRARDFADTDRDQFVAARNLEHHWMQQGSAAEWRYWENLMKDPKLLRVTIDAPDGVAAIGDIGVGFTARPDGSQHIDLTVLAPHRRKGIGTASTRRRSWRYRLFVRRWKRQSRSGTRRCAARCP